MRTVLEQMLQMPMKRCRSGETVTLVKRLRTMEVKRDRIGRRLKYDLEHFLIAAAARTKKVCEITILASDVVVMQFRVNPLEFGWSVFATPVVFPMRLRLNAGIKARAEFQDGHGIAYVNVGVWQRECIRRGRATEVKTH